MGLNLLDYKIINQNEITKDCWHTFIDNHPQSTIFHTPIMCNIFNSTPNYESFALFAVNKLGDVKAMLSGYVQTISSGILKSLSKRAVIMQSPIYINTEALNLLLSYYKVFIRHNAVYSEIRNHNDSSNIRDIYEKNNYKYEEHLNILINVNQHLDDIFKRMSPTRRKQINRGYRRGVFSTIIENNDTVGLNTCIKIIQDVYMRIKLPLPDVNMLNTANKLSNKDEKFVCFALKFENEIIGTRMILCYKDRIYDWFAGSKEEHYDKYPNDILPWEVFKWGHNNGYRIFDFGGAGKPNVPYGVRDYKLKFGGDLVNFGRYQIIHSPTKYWIAVMGFNLLRIIKGAKS